MREARPRLLGLSLRCLLPCLGQAVRSKDRCEKTTGGGARRTGFPDGPRNIASFVQWPLPHSPRCGVGGGYDCLCSSPSYNACLRETGCEFFRWPASTRIGFSPI